jgi:hypothetical protein
VKYVTCAPLVLLRINSRNSPCRQGAPAILLILGRLYSRWDFVAQLLVDLGFCRIRFWYLVAPGSGISREASRIHSWTLTAAAAIFISSSNHAPTRQEVIQRCHRATGYRRDMKADATSSAPKAAYRQCVQSARPADRPPGAAVARRQHDKAQTGLYTFNNVSEAHPRFQCCRLCCCHGRSAGLRGLRHTRPKAISDRSGIPADDVEFCVDSLRWHHGIDSRRLQLLLVVDRASSNWSFWHIVSLGILT